MLFSEYIKLMRMQSPKKERGPSIRSFSAKARGRSMRSFSAEAIHITLTLVSLTAEKKYSRKCFEPNIIKTDHFIR